MDGNRRYEVVTSCDHLHRSHASYLNQTQMLGHDMSFSEVFWMRDKIFRATVLGMPKWICDAPAFLHLNLCFPLNSLFVLAHGIQWVFCEIYFILCTNFSVLVF